MNAFRRSTLILMLLVAATQFAIARGGELPADGKLAVGEGYHLLKLVEFNDLNDIIVTDGKQSVRIELASVLPLADWPRSAKGMTLKEKFLKELQAGLVGKEVSLDVMDINEKGKIIGDVTLGPSSSFAAESWHEGGYAAGVGWGMTSVNILLIERGYSPYIKRVYKHVRGPEYVWDLFDDAEKNAKRQQAGFRALKDSANEIESIAASLSNECDVALRGLEWPQLMAVARQLITLPDAKIRHSLVRMMSEASRNNPEQREWCDVLLAQYFKEPELVIRRHMLITLDGSGLPAEQARQFLKQVLETETNEEIQSIATFWQRRLKDK